MIKRLLFAALFTLGIVSSSHAQTWKPDKAHSSVSFMVHHLVITKVTGNFTDFDGTVNFDGKDFTKGGADFTIQSKSISTGQSNRDDDLKSSHFFAVDSFPTITFKSTKVEPADSTHFKLTGDMTMHGITKPVTFDCTFNGTAEGMGPIRASFSASTIINRLDFGITWSHKLDNGTVVVSNEVAINLELELLKAKS